ncbi:MAG: nitrile hydratase accessory protein [Granulosicoccus sp.]
MTSSPTRSLDMTTQDALQEVDSIPRRDNEPVFNEPWEAEVFALTLSLYEQRLFTWQEWADTLSKSIKDAQDDGDPDSGNTYYLHWLAALEQVVVDKQVGNSAQLAKLYQAWDHAARTTAHGQPIELS